MPTQVRINLDEELIPSYPDMSPETARRTNAGIDAKIRQVLVVLPCRPRVGDCLNLQSFEAQFGLTEFERECLADCNYLVTVTEVVICRDFLEVYVKKVD